MVSSVAGAKMCLRSCIHTTHEHWLGGPEISRQFKQYQRSILTCKVCPCWRQCSRSVMKHSRPSDQGIIVIVRLLVFSGRQRLTWVREHLTCELACSFYHAQLTEVLGHIQRTWDRSLVPAQSIIRIQDLRYQSLILLNVLLNTP